MMKLKCTCGSIMSVAKNLAGRQASCGSCGKKFTIPASKSNSKIESTSPAATPAATQSSARRQQSGFPCPSCDSTLEHGTIVCMRCGYHTKLMRKLEAFDADQLTLATSELESKKLATWIALYPAAFIFVVAAAFWARGVQGPDFLVFFYSAFCLFGIATLIGRKLWCDTDIFNNAAAAALVGVGVIRIVDSIMGARFKFMFLLIGIIVSVGVFMVPTTESSSKIESPFTSKSGGLASIPFALLFGLAAISLACVFFVPVVGNVVVKMGMLIATGLGIGVGSAWGALHVDDFFKGGRFGSSHFDDHSCGGGGGCGGGCGGCGD